MWLVLCKSYLPSNSIASIVFCQLQLHVLSATSIAAYCWLNSWYWKVCIKDWTVFYSILAKLYYTVSYCFLTDITPYWLFLLQSGRTTLLANEKNSNLLNQEKYMFSCSPRANVLQFQNCSSWPLYDGNLMFETKMSWTSFPTSFEFIVLPCQSKSNGIVMLNCQPIFSSNVLFLSFRSSESQQTCLMYWPSLLK